MCGIEGRADGADHTSGRYWDDSLLQWRRRWSRLLGGVDRPGAEKKESCAEAPHAPAP